METRKLLDGVLKQIKPTDRKLFKEINEFLKKLNSEIKKSKTKAKAVVGGSIAKDTFLKGDHDCDIFVKFDCSYKEKDISCMLFKILKPFKAELVHGSRDYYRVKNMINYEVVPVLDIKDPKDAVNVTDMSPLHVEWVRKHPGFDDEIRLAKQFCKAAHVYGAESYIKGFSGHVLDVLVIHYGGFIKLLKASRKWKDKEVIDPEKFYRKSRKDALEQLNRSKIDSPIIIIDPVLPERNAAAALSYEKLELFKKAAAEFIDRPSQEQFIVKQKTAEVLRRGAGKDKLMILDVTPFTGKEDVVGAKLLKAYQQIYNQLKFYDFGIKDAGWSWDKKDKAMFWYILDPKDLVPIKKWVGPPLEEKERVQNFREKHVKTFMEKGRICTYVKRRYIRAEELADDIIRNDDYLYEKVKKVVRQ
ncbi:nucleotidyltransferase domain-containing protein [Candidatus Woesearchaeota archaeon]|nr:nucleotidyltransferase domain-containing protein [Candidatus Woesearchaeota archaeon]